MLVKIIALCTLFVSMLSQAAVVVDQTHLLVPGSGGSISFGNGQPNTSFQPFIGQTFAVGVSGTLNSLELDLSRLVVETSIDFSLSIYALIDGQPNFSATPLFSEIYSTDILPLADTDPFRMGNQLTRFKLLSAGLAVSAGDQLVFTLGQLTPSASDVWSQGLMVGVSWGDPGYEAGTSGWINDQLEWNANGFRAADLFFVTTVSTVPVPATAWLFGSALLGLASIKRRK